MSVPDHFGLHRRPDIDTIRTERDELSRDLGKLRAATRVRVGKKAIASLKKMLEAMEAMDESDGPALRILIEMHDKLEAI